MDGKNKKQEKSGKKEDRGKKVFPRKTLEVMLSDRGDIGGGRVRQGERGAAV